MKTFEYTKNEGCFLLTSASQKEGGSAKFLFVPRCNGSLKIGSKAFSVKGGEADVDARALEDGIYSPVFISEDGRGHTCDKLRVEAGSIFPTESRIDDLCLMKKKAAAAQAALTDISARLERLEDAVFGKTIF